jgi:hypothetical protein
MSRRDSLLRLASEHGVSPSVVASILDTVNAHPDLIDLPRILAGLLGALRVSAQGQQISIAGGDPLVWREVCNWIISLRAYPDISTVLGDRFWLGEQAPARNPVLNRGVKHHGYPYAALWHVPIDGERAADYERLLAQLLASTQQAGHENLVPQRYAVFLALRQLCEQRTLLIPPELSIWGPQSGFISSCKLFSPSESRNANAEQFARICRLVRYCSGEEPPTRAYSGGGGSRRAGERNPEMTHVIGDDPRGFVLGDPDDPDQLPGHYSVLMGPSETFEGELAPGEFSPADELWLVDDQSAPRPYAADKLSLQAVQAHIARSRQFLPSSYSQFTLPELRDLLFGASNMFEACRRELVETSRRAELQLRMESVVFLHICLWLGQPATQVALLTLVESEGECADALALVKQAAGFSVVVRRPELVGDTRLQPETGVRQSALRVVLPDLAGSLGLVGTLFRSFSRVGNSVFTHDTETLEREARALLTLLGGGDPRFTINKVRNYLFHQIISDTQDVATAALLSGIRVPSADTPRYYLQLDTAYLTAVYSHSLGRVLRQIYACAGLAYEPPDARAVSQGSVGASHCLLPDTIQSNVHALSASLRKRPAGRLSDMVSWHNRYTLWVVQMFMFSTASRAVAEPLRFCSEFDAALGIGALSDKDGTDRHMSRLVWLPPEVLRQLENYGQHCIGITRTLTGYLSRSDGERWARGFFLEITDGGIRRQEIRPTTIIRCMEQVPSFVPHRVNAFRKFLRTELTERGCPAEVLGAFMGHWLRGEEPQDQHASFCPAGYVRDLELWVTPLMRELGWHVVSSPWSAL